MESSVKIFLTAVVMSTIFSNIEGFTKRVKTELFTGTPVNSSILDLMIYFQGRSASNDTLRAWTMPCENCTTNIDTELYNEITQSTGLPRFGIIQYSCLNKIQGNAPSKEKQAQVCSCCYFYYTVTDDMVLRLQKILKRRAENCEFKVMVFDTETTLHSIHVSIRYYGCWPNIDSNGIRWDAALPNTTLFRPCPGYSTGIVFRFCSAQGVFVDPVYNCAKSEVGEILSTLQKLLSGPINPTEAARTLQKLSKATVSGKDGLNDTDVQLVVNSLHSLTDKKFITLVKNKIVYEKIFNIANNLFDVNNTKAWRNLVDKDSFGSEQLIEVVDKTMMHVVTAGDESMDEGDTKVVTYSMQNLVLSMGSTAGCSEALTFPNRRSDLTEWVKDTENSIRLPCNSTKDSSSFTSTYFKNISRLFSTTRVKTKSSFTEDMDINSGVMTFTLYPVQQQALRSDIEIQFDLYSSQLLNPICGFWSANKSTNTSGFWSSDGCRVKKSTKDTVICSCNHLTNFAILMSPSKTPKEHLPVLQAISVAGCIISMICLVSTVVLYIALWRHVGSDRSGGTSDKSVMLLNLCASLFAGYLIFIAGVSKTENKVGCKIVAVLLHYIFLVVFFTMLAEGVILVRMVLRPLSTSISIAKKMLIAAWGIPAVIVAISTGATRLEGYGNKKFCWLSVDSGLIWTFASPALIIIAANSIMIAVVLWKMCTTAVMQNKSEKEKLKAGMWSLCILLPLVGITWVTGVFAVNEESVAFQYIFAIVNSLQGLAIFIFHCLMNKTIRDALKRTKDRILTSKSLDNTQKSDSKKNGPKKADQGTENSELNIYKPFRSTN